MSKTQRLMAQFDAFHCTLPQKCSFALSVAHKEMSFGSSHQTFASGETATQERPRHAGLKSGLCRISKPFKAPPQGRGRKTALVSRLGVAGGMTVRALQGGQRAPRRLVDVIRTIPRISKAYFKSPFRRALYGGISLLVGFYVAQTISLTFGALGINDVIAAAICLLFTEYVTKYYRTREEMTFAVGLLNNFKMGFTYGLFIDAFKLAS